MAGPAACTRTSCVLATRRYPILYDVDRIRDGTSFTTSGGSSPSSMARRSSTCRARLSNDNSRVFDHQPTPSPMVPRSRGAARLAHPARAFEEVPAWFKRAGPIDTRYPRWDPHDRAESRPRTSGCGCGLTARCPTTLAARLRGDLRQRPHVAGHDAAPPRRDLARPQPDDGEPRPRHVVPPALPRRRVAALDQHTPSAVGGRGFATGSIFSADGRLVVSVAQEGLIRRARWQSAA